MEGVRGFVLEQKISPVAELSIGEIVENKSPDLSERGYTEL